MKKRFIFLAVVMLLGLPQCFLYAQEEKPSAALYTEEYTDAFQEHFFDALKNYAIENYEKAIRSLETCKKLQPDYAVIDFELSKNYFELRQYFRAEDYMLKALKADPENIWYLEGLFTVYEAQNNTGKAIEVATRLSTINPKYKENLVRLYTRSGNYISALKLLDELDEELGTTSVRRNQRIRIMTMKNYDDELEQEIHKNAVEIEENTKNPLESIKNDVDNLIKESDYLSLEKLTEEALEVYPAQAELYYFNALAKNKLNKHEPAIEALTMGLEFVIDDSNLENRMYTQMVEAYKAIGNTRKVEEYNKKIKTGL